MSSVLHHLEIESRNRAEAFGNIRMSKVEQANDMATKTYYVKENIS